MPARKFMILYGVWTAFLAAVFFAIPAIHLVTWLAIGLSSVVAIGYGVHRYQPRRTSPWMLMLTAILVFSVGDAVYNIYTLLGDPNPFPSLADAFYLLMYPLAVLGLLGLSRSASANRFRVLPLDAVIFTISAGLLWWVILVGPTMNDPDLSMTQRLLSIAYPLGDLLMVAAVGRLVVLTRANLAVVLLAIGVAGILFADVFYGMIQVSSGTWAVGGPVDVGWLVFYVTWGAAPLHPSMFELTEPRVIRRREMSLPRQALLAVAALIPSIVMLVELLRGQVGHVLVIAVFAAVTAVLVLVRLLGVIDKYRHSSVRAARLREAMAALVAATDVPGVLRALRRAVDRLLRPGTDYRFLVVMNDGSVPELFATTTVREAELRYTQTLPPSVGAALGDFELTLVCPITLDDQPDCQPLGLLLISSDESALGFLRAPMEVMTTQVALAIDRIRLSGELERHNNELYFHALVYNSLDAILILDPGTDVIRYACPAAAGVFGVDGLVGMNLLSLIASTDEHGTADLSELVNCGGRDTGADWVIRRPEGPPLQADVSCRDLRDEPIVGGTVVTIRDVTAQRQLESELTHRAFHDALTGLPNRVLFQERMGEAITRAHETGTVAGVLFLDLDDFKVVNDTLGHGSGDELLRAVGRRLAGSLRPGDIAARLGGDEFAALIEDVPDAGAVEAVAERIVTQLAEPFSIGDRVVSGVASIGVATSSDAVDGPDMLRQADLALYVAKGAGKGQWRRYQPALHAAFVRRLELRTALDQALLHNEFELEFQPIVALRSGLASGFEALLRWNHPSRGRLTPDQFIDVAEESGLIVPMGNWVLNQAVRAAAKWHRSFGPLYVSINVSARQFRTPGFVQTVYDALAAAELPHNSLMLEITESLLLRDDDSVWGDLATLRQSGIRVAIDDFGTGYSSLSYLRHLPLDVIKIDRLFTVTMTSSAQQAALVDAIVTLARALGLEVIAEGVETSAERDQLARIGCPYGQGFLFARPLPLDQVFELIRAERILV